MSSATCLAGILGWVKMDMCPQALFSVVSAGLVLGFMVFSDVEELQLQAFAVTDSALPSGFMGKPF